MKRAAAIIAFAAVVGVVALIGPVKREVTYKANRERADGIAAELRARFAKDCRFEAVVVAGYSVHGGIWSASDHFYVMGCVASTNDFLELEKILHEAQPPGQLSLRSVSINPEKQNDFQGKTE
jgi:hypothetical protein